MSDVGILEHQLHLQPAPEPRAGVAGGDEARGAAAADRTGRVAERAPLADARLRGSLRRLVRVLDPLVALKPAEQLPDAGSGP